jgi:hypothetical protein
MAQNAQKEQERLSPCCQTTIWTASGDGVLIGSCSSCGQAVIRRNPRTGREEWLDGHSPWTRNDLRPIEERHDTVLPDHTTPPRKGFDPTDRTIGCNG